MKQLAFTLLIFATCFANMQAAPKLQPGAGRYETERAGKTVPVWYFIPDAAGPETPIVFVMHGTKRDGKRYRDDWQPLASRHGFILIAPEFSREEYPTDSCYNLGGTITPEGTQLPPGQWGFDFIEMIFDQVRADTGNRSASYHLYGHSAGAQFVHRFLYFVPNARVANAVAANAGWWTVPDPEIDFPHGLRGSRIGEDAIRQVLQRPLVLLLGTNDNDPNHEFLNRSPNAMAQGPHRLARGHHAYEAAQHRAEKLGVPFGWKLALAHGIGHVDKGMSEFAVEWIFGQPKTVNPVLGRAPSHVRVLFGGDTDYAEILSENPLTRYQPRPLTEPEFSAFAALVSAMSGWDEATRAAVTRGRDDHGHYLELGDPVHD